MDINIADIIIYREFARVEFKDNKTILEGVSPFWEQPDFPEQWKNRKTSKKLTSIKQYKWHEQLKNAINPQAEKLIEET